MAGYTIAGGSTFETATPAEVRQIVAEERAIEEAREREAFRGIKWMRLPLLTGTAASSALSIGQASQVGPASGYVWSLRRLIVNGLTSGGTPDVVNLFSNSAGTSIPLWQFNGNNFGYTFSKGEMTLRPGEILLLASVGTFAATGQITLSGELIEVPAEMLAKLL